MRNALCRNRISMGIAAAFLGLCFVSSAFAAPKVAHEPVEIVTEIYRVAAGPNGKYEGQSAIENKQVRKQYFSKSLVAALVAMKKREKDGPILDFDPITNSQDPSVKNLSITQESKTDTKAVVVAKFFSFDEKEPSIVRYDFIKDGADWKIDEITGQRGGDKTQAWSLRKVISE
jgi:hypothetical protein